MLKIGIQFFAHHKGGGSTKNGRDSEPKIKFYFMLIGKDKDETVAKMEAYRASLGV